MARYSATAMDHFLSPRNAGVLEDYDVEGFASLPGQMPFMRLYLRLRGEVIEAASFSTFGCGAAIATGSILTELICGRELSQCHAITAEELDQLLGELPHERKFCLDLAVSALRNALSQA